MKDFFDNRNLIVIIDEMGKRYGKLPSEILSDYTIFEFCLSSAIMVAAKIEEDKAIKGSKHSDKIDWSSKGFDRTVIRKKRGA